MASLWVGTLFYTLQVTGAIVWIPVVLTILGMLGIYTLNMFIMGGKFEKKANTSDVVMIKQYEKDTIALNEKISSKADRDILEAYMKLTNQFYVALHERMDKVEEFKDEANKHYVALAQKLGSIDTSIKNIEKNCDKQTCKK